MVYPHTYITKRVRRGIMIGLIMIFFLATPSIILYTAGYRYDFTHHQIQPTGVISLSIEPPDADVYLNNTLLTRSPAIRFDTKAPWDYYLKNRAPGTYDVSIEKNGYYPWRETIQVESNKTTYLSHIVLFPILLPIKITPAEKNITHLIGSFDGRYTALTSVDHGVFDITLLDNKTDEFAPLARFTSSSPQVTWSPFDNVGYILSTTTNGLSLHLFSANDESVHKQYIIPNSTHLTHQWSRDAYIPSIYVQTGTSIKKISTSGSSTIGFVSSTAWYVDALETIWEKRTSTHSINATVIGEQIPLPEGIHPDKIIDINPDRAIVQQHTTVHTIQRKNNETIPSNSITDVRQVSYRKKTNEWFLLTSNELWRVDREGRTSLIMRLSDPLVDARMLPRYRSILYATDNHIAAFHEATNHYIPLFSGGKIHALTVDETRSNIYFLGTIGQKTDIYKLPLTP